MDPCSLSCFCCLDRQTITDSGAVGHGSDLLDSLGEAASILVLLLPNVTGMLNSSQLHAQPLRWLSGRSTGLTSCPPLRLLRATPALLQCGTATDSECPLQDVWQRPDPGCFVGRRSGLGIHVRASNSEELKIPYVTSQTSSEFWGLSTDCATCR